MRIAMARGAGRAALPEADALPQSDRVVREAAWAAIGPVRQLAIRSRVVLEPRREEIEVVVAGLVAWVDDIAKRMTLRTDHAARLWIEPGRPHNQAFGRRTRERRGRVHLDMRAPRSVAPFA